MRLALLIVLLFPLTAAAQSYCRNCGREMTRVRYRVAENYPARNYTFSEPRRRQAVSRPRSSGVRQVAGWGSGRLYEVAVASARYRAARGVRGHCAIEMGHTAGVGWATNNPQPRTCYWSRRRQGAYASFAGRNGYYSTLVLR